jgi:hypothetical protein
VGTASGKVLSSLVTAISNGVIVGDSVKVGDVVVGLELSLDGADDGTDDGQKKMHWL